jgi:hypothetical protein
MLESAEYWQKRADEAKAEADKMHDPECKEIMLDIAKAYERIADFARQGRQDPKPTKNESFARRYARSRMISRAWSQSGRGLTTITPNSIKSCEPWRWWGCMGGWMNFAATTQPYVLSVFAANSDT